VFRQVENVLNHWTLLTCPRWVGKHISGALLHTHTWFTWSYLYMLYIFLDADSDMSIGMNPFRNYRSFDLATLPNGSSSSNANREQQSPVSASSQSIQSREPSAILRTLESCSYMFDPAVRPKVVWNIAVGLYPSCISISLLHMMLLFIHSWKCNLI
jgi:hypothetical protein